MKVVHAGEKLLIICLVDLFSECTRNIQLCFTQLNKQYLYFKLRSVFKIAVPRSISLSTTVRSLPDEMYLCLLHSDHHFKCYILCCFCQMILKAMYFILLILSRHSMDLPDPVASRPLLSPRPRHSLLYVYIAYMVF